MTESKVRWIKYIPVDDNPIKRDIPISKYVHMQGPKDYAGSFPAICIRTNVYQEVEKNHHTVTSIIIWNHRVVWESTEDDLICFGEKVPVQILEYARTTAVSRYYSRIQRLFE